MAFWDFIKPPPAILLGQQIGLIVSSEDLYDDAIGGFTSEKQIVSKVSALGKEVVAFAYRPLNFPAGKYMAQLGDKAYFKKSNGLVLHEEVIAVHTDKNIKNAIFRGFHGGGHGMTEDPELANYLQAGEYKLYKEAWVLNDNVNSIALLEAMKNDSRFDEPKEYDFVKRNCQFFAKAFREKLQKDAAIKFRAKLN